MQSLTGLSQCQLSRKCLLALGSVTMILLSKSVLPMPPRSRSLVFRRLLISCLSAASFLIVLSPSQKAEAQGLFAGSKGARVAGRGGAFGAKADDLSAVEYNPAGLTKLGTTTLQLSNRFSYNMSSFKREAAYEDADVTAINRGQYVQFDQVKNGQPWQALDPLIGVGSNFGLKDFAAALVAYAPPGSARMSFPQGASTSEQDPRYLSTGGQRYMMVERDAEILIYALSAAYKYKNIFGVGATAQWIHVPRLNYSLVVAPTLVGNGGDQVRSQLDMVSTVEAKDPFTLNAIFGAWVKPAPFLEFGLSGQVIPAAINAKGTIHLNTANGGTQLETSRNGVPANDVALNIPLPMWGRFASRYVKEIQGEFKYDIELDLTYHTWSRVKTLELTSNGLVASLPAGELDVGDVKIEKQWHNGLTVQLGGDVAVIPKLLTLRAGAGYESAIADPSYSHVDFSTGHQLSGSVGASVFLGHFELAMAYSYRHMLQVTTTAQEGKVYQVNPGNPCVAPYTDPVRCPVPGQASPTVNGGSYNAYNHFLNMDVLYRF